MTSYPVPPQSSFTCAPYSFLLRRNDNSATRHTYACLENDGLSIQSFEEQVFKHEVRQPTKRIHKLDAGSSPIKFFHSASPCMQSASTIDVVALQKDGSVRCLSSDMSATKWHTRIADPTFPKQTIKIIYSCTLDWEEASSSILVNRQDVLQRVAGVQSMFLFAIYQQQHGSQDHFWGLWTLSQLQDHSAKPIDEPALPLLRHQLQDTKAWNKDTSARYDVDPRRGRLNITGHGGCMSYDLRSYIPKSTLELNFATDHDPVQTALRLGGGAVIAASHTSVRLYDTKYTSVQSSLQLSTIGARKRKRSENFSILPMKFVMYFSKDRKVIAIHGKKLLSIQIAASTRQIDSGVSLADAMNKSLDDKSSLKYEGSSFGDLQFASSLMPSDTTYSRWHHLQQQLEALLQEDNVPAFEELLLEDLAPQNGFLHNERTRTQQEIQIKARYVLSKLLTFAKVGTRDELTILRPLPRLLDWVIDIGSLHPHAIRQSLSAEFDIIAQLSPATVPRLLKRQDTSLSLLARWLRKTTVLPCETCAEVVKIMIDAALKNAERSQMASPASSVQDSLNDAEPENETSKDLELDSEPKKSLGYSEGLTHKLNDSLSRFATYAVRDIIKLFETYFEQSELLTLIQHLRQQLFRTGHTSSVLSRSILTPPQTPDQPSTQALMLAQPSGNGTGKYLSLCDISTLLSCCISVIGTASLLSSDSGFLQTLIPELKSEVSLALTSIQEASYLSGLTRELLRYANTTRQYDDSHPHMPRLTHESMSLADATQQKPGTIVTLYTERPEDILSEAGRLGSGALPMNLKDETFVSNTKLRKGAGGIEVTRSERERLHLKGRTSVGVYSFERLVL